MRFTRRPQGRIPVRLAPTHWLITLRGIRWEGDSLSGLHRFLVVNDPQPGDEVQIWRNSRCLYRGSWASLADEATLW